MNKTLKYLFEKMFSYVDADIEKFDLTENDWYLKREWTEEQEKDYIEWLKNEIKTNSEVRKLFNLSEHSYKKIIDDNVAFFVGNYGWKTKKF